MAQAGQPPEELANIDDQLVSHHTLCGSHETVLNGQPTQVFASWDLTSSSAALQAAASSAKIAGRGGVFVDSAFRPGAFAALQIPLPSNDCNEACTITFWERRAASSGSYCVLGVGEAASRGFSFMHGPGTDGAVFVESGDQEQPVELTGTASVVEGWNHHAIAFGTAHTIWYVNGSPAVVAARRLMGGTDEAGSRTATLGNRSDLLGGDTSESALFAKLVVHSGELSVEEVRAECGRGVQDSCLRRCPPSSQKSACEAAALMTHMPMILQSSLPAVPRSSGENQTSLLPPPEQHNTQHVTAPAPSVRQQQEQSSEGKQHQPVSVQVVGSPSSVPAAAASSVPAALCLPPARVPMGTGGMTATNRSIDTTTTCSPAVTPSIPKRQLSAPALGRQSWTSVAMVAQPVSSPKRERGSPYGTSAHVPRMPGIASPLVQAPTAMSVRHHSQPTLLSSQMSMVRNSSLLTSAAAPTLQVPRTPTPLSGGQHPQAVPQAGNGLCVHRSPTAAQMGSTPASFFLQRGALPTPPLTASVPTLALSSGARISPTSGSMALEPQKHTEVQVPTLLLQGSSSSRSLTPAHATSRTTCSQSPRRLFSMPTPGHKQMSISISTRPNLSGAVCGPTSAASAPATPNQVTTIVRRGRLASPAAQKSTTVVAKHKPVSPSISPKRHHALKVPVLVEQAEHQPLQQEPQAERQLQLEPEDSQVQQKQQSQSQSQSQLSSVPAAVMRNMVSEQPLPQQPQVQRLASQPQLPTPAPQTDHLMSEAGSTIKSGCSVETVEAQSMETDVRDQIDAALAVFVEREKPQVQFVRIAPGQYLVGTDRSSCL
eukprot:gnl/TRDRNA2_/TRDRNA2_161269_c1_seq1.p1 gnl/TRDRNA2_/TRDRNA2_161269_c1~~gnl/TRDRNA2_/TRDRNA2_161269_c1_seq1.p1  ORF type:complete len:889 (-),score=140.15 gnl/TRDRNA2_/TRDRNA2_161269_c1_seq1:9-2489(-)